MACLSHPTSNFVQNLKEVLEVLIPEHTKNVKDFVKEHGSHPLGQVTIEQVRSFSTVYEFFTCFYVSYIYHVFHIPLYWILDHKLKVYLHWCLDIRSTVCIVSLDVRWHAWNQRSHHRDIRARCRVWNPFPWLQHPGMSEVASKGSRWGRTTPGRTLLAPRHRTDPNRRTSQGHFKGV